MTISSSTPPGHGHDTQPLLLRDRSSGSPQGEAATLFSLLDSKSTSSVSRKYRDTGSPASYESTSSTDSTLQTDDLVEPDEEGSRFSESLMRLFGRRGGKGRALELDVDACATRRSVFDDDVLAKHYWPKEDYEGFERFDVSARWSVREENVRLIPSTISSCIRCREIDGAG